MHLGSLTRVFSVAFLLASLASAGVPTTIVVDGGSPDWAFLPETGTPTGFFSVGPDTPPAGDGSALLETDDSADGIALMRHGRMPLKPSRIRGIEGLRRIIAKAETFDRPQELVETTLTDTVGYRSFRMEPTTDSVMTRAPVSQESTAHAA